MTPTVSIIVPNYNHASFLEQRLNSIMAQTYQDFELILLDDCSTDNSVALLKKYSNHPKVSHIVVNKQNSGSPFKQWQKGLQLAKGKYIWIAESDDYCESGFLEQLMQTFANNKKIGIAYAQSIDVTENGMFLGDRIQYTNEFNPNIWVTNFELDGKYFVQSYLNKKNVIPNASAVLFKKELVQAIFFNNALQKMTMCGDWYFWVQFILQTHIAFVAQPLNYFRMHDNASRNHRTLAIRKQRLLEEKEILNYLIKNKLHQPKLIKIFYNKWFHLFGKKALIKKELYKGKLQKTTIFTFIGFFLSYQFFKN